MTLLKTLLACSLTITALTVQAAGADSFFGATLQMPDGKPLATASLRGKPLVLVFWERDCDGCAVQQAELAKAETQQRASGLKALGILIDKRAEAINEPVPPVKSPLTTVVTDQRKGLWLMQNLGNPGGGVPFVAVIDRQGQIVARSKRLMTAAELATALATPPK